MTALQLSITYGKVAEGGLLLGLRVCAQFPVSVLLLDRSLCQFKRPFKLKIVLPSLVHEQPGTH